MTNLNKWIFTQEQDSGGFIISVMNFGLDRAMCFCTHLTKKKTESTKTKLKTCQYYRVK